MPGLSHPVSRKRCLDGANLRHAGDECRSGEPEGHRSEPVDQDDRDDPGGRPWSDARVGHRLAVLPNLGASAAVARLSPA